MNKASDYSEAISAKPRPLTLEEAAYITPPTQIVDTESILDVARLRAYRQNRLRALMKAQGVGAVILGEPLGIRYAAGVRNCALFQTHIQAGYLFVPQEGPVVYFDSEPGRYSGAQLETINEVRDDILPISYMFAGHRHQEWSLKWADQMDDLIKAHCGGGKQKIALDRIGFHAEQALMAKGHEVIDVAPVLAAARKIKSPEEILAMNLSIAIAEEGMTRMRNNLVVGITETQIWSHMWAALIENGGEWIDYRLLASGERSNPWQQEAGSRKIRAGDLLVFDCGLVGPFAYGADISRVFHCGPGKPTDEQKKMYTMAWEELTHNKTLMHPGAAFSDIAKARYLPEESYGKQLYPCLAHGIGMADEWPAIMHSTDHPDFFEGELEVGMTMCIESYIGEIGGVEGIKLEDQILITENGPIQLSRYPYEDDLLI